MAYFFAEEPFRSTTRQAPNAAPAVPVRPSLTALEWSVVALARGDRLSSLREPDRLAIAMGGLFGASHNPRLACPRLEALRKVAVLSWRRRALARDELAAFTDAGFSHSQLQLIVSSIERAGPR